MTPATQVRAPDLLGHGGREVPDALKFDEMSEDVVRWLDRERIDRAYLFGYSFGGYLALYLARFYPERVRAVISVIVKHVYDVAAIGHIVHLAGPERVRRNGNPRLAELERMHGTDQWAKVTENTATLFQSFSGGAPLAIDDFRAIRQPVLLLAAGNSLVPLADSRALAALLPNARLGLFPGSAHPIRNVALATTMRAAKDFIAEVEAGRFSPGGTIDLAPKLVEGGLSGPKLNVSIRDRR